MALTCHQRLVMLQLCAMPLVSWVTALAWHHRGQAAAALPGFWSTPPPQGHAVAVPLILGASHCCILSFHSCVLPSWGPNYCGDPQRLRSWLLGRSAHACTSDIWSAIITSAPGPQDLVSLLHCVPVHQTWYQEAFPLDRTPCHRKKRRKGRPLQSLPRRTPTALDTTAAYRTFVVSVKEEPHSLCQCWPQLM